MKPVSLWRLIGGAAFFVFGLSILFQAIKDVLKGSALLLSLDFISAFLCYLFALLITAALVFPSRAHKKGSTT